MNPDKMATGASARILFILSLLGLALLLYPFVSNYYNSFRATHAIMDYSDTVATMDEEKLCAVRASAEEYNRCLATEHASYDISDSMLKRYYTELDVNEDGIMGYIDIPKINVWLPIYHGTDDSVLQIAAGHIPWSSLPVGGDSSHCVISGHRGLPSATLFSDLDKLETGDEVLLHVLNETYTYVVDSVSIVLPQDIQGLQIREGSDLLSLVTCTPYGINSHRLIVHCVRTGEAAETRTITVTPDAAVLPLSITTPLIGIPMLGLFLSLQALMDQWIRKYRRV